MEKFIKKIVVGFAIMFMLLPILRIFTPILIGNPLKYHDLYLLWMSFAIWLMYFAYQGTEREFNFDLRFLKYLCISLLFTAPGFLFFKIYREYSIEEYSTSSDARRYKGSDILTCGYRDFDNTVLDIYEPIIPGFIYKIEEISTI